MKNNYKVGQKVVHLSHGLGTITSIEEREFQPGNTCKVIILNIKDCGAPKKVFVPFESADQRIRPVMDQKTMYEVLSIIKRDSSDPIEHQTWQRRYREYMEKIHSGDVKAIAQVFVSLRKLKYEKDLSFGERKLYDQCKTLLQKEMNAAGIELEFV